jgi:hypothetical protein
LEAISNRIEMHKNIGQQRENWKHTFIKLY